MVGYRPAAPDAEGGWWLLPGFGVAMLGQRLQAAIEHDKVTVQKSGGYDKWLLKHDGPVGRPGGQNIWARPAPMKATTASPGADQHLSQEERARRAAAAAKTVEQTKNNLHEVLRRSSWGPHS